MKRAEDRELLPGNRVPNSPRRRHDLDASLLIAGVVALVFCFVWTARLGPKARRGVLKQRAERLGRLALEWTLRTLQEIANNIGSLFGG